MTLSDGLITSGSLPRAHSELFERADASPSDWRRHADFVEAANGIVVGMYVSARRPKSLRDVTHTPSVYDDEASSILQSPSMEDLVFRAETTTFAGFPRISQIVAYETGFAALGSDGRVWTWGDDRYPACLGRDVTAEK